MSPSLRERIERGDFILTGEVAPPKGADLTGTVERAVAMAAHVDAVNITDNQRAVMRMGNLAVAAALLRAGVEPVLQMTCRDRNRLALQSDLLAAHALGVRNVLALTGDPIRAGTQPDSKAVFDLSSAKLVETIVALNSGRDLAGRPINPPTALLPGAVVNPNLDKLSGQVGWLHKKIAAGARFIQTQAIYEVERWQRFAAAAGNIQVPVLAGVLVLKNAQMARFLNQEVPGVVVPETLIARLEAAKDQREEGMAIAVELALALRPYVRGIHLMSVGQERTLAEVAAELRRRL